VKLPNAHLATIERHKVVEYLLKAAHPDNSGKARFFESLSFSIEEPERLIAALRRVAENGHVIESAQSAHGQKYIVDGWLWAHTEENQRRVRTVWIIDRDRETPRLVTACPGKE
jgi:hypothetical protein